MKNAGGAVVENVALDKPIQVLLIEDNLDDVRLTVEGFKVAEPQVQLNSVEDGPEAFAFLKKQGKYSNAPSTDLIILDLKLPKMDGWDVLSTIKSDSMFRHIPVVILTSSIDDDDANRAYSLHANCFIHKPSTFSEYLKILNRLGIFWTEVAKLPTR
jgi:two-component system response regulator